MKLEEIVDPIRPELAAVKKSYSSQLKQCFALINGIGSHLAKSRGKFFRPALVLLSAKSGNIRSMDKAISAGVAVEFIHAASLIHDDVIDEAALRRKQKTVNSKWGNAVSVIAGDYLLAKSFDIISKLNEPRIVSGFSNTAARMCEGEMAQLANTYNFNITQRQYLDIIKRKSAYLISNCCAAGGILGGLPDKKIECLAAYGLYTGMAFQIADDCLDLTGDEKNLGKSARQDVDEGKLTLPLIFMLNKSGRKSRARASELITRGGASAHKILKEEAVNSGAISCSRRTASFYIRLAKEKLPDLRATLKKPFLDLADYVLEREN